MYWYRPQAPTPNIVQELCSFLGLVNYYGKFISNLVTILYPLNALLRKNCRWKWTDECALAFNAAKEGVALSHVLTHYNPSLPLRMAGDASAYSIGAVISHIMPDSTEHPIAFASRILSSSECDYAQVEKEALSLVFGVKQFHNYLYGRNFTLVTDDKPLTTILGPKKCIPPLVVARLQRWAIILSAYTQFRPTQAHANADGLSRLLLNDNTTEGRPSEPRDFNISQVESIPVTSSQLRRPTYPTEIFS